MMHGADMLEMWHIPQGYGADMPRKEHVPLVREADMRKLRHIPQGYGADMPRNEHVPLVHGADMRKTWHIPQGYGADMPQKKHVPQGSLGDMRRKNILKAQHTRCRAFSFRGYSEEGLMFYFSMWKLVKLYLGK